MKTKDSSIKEEIRSICNYSVSTELMLDTLTDELFSLFNRYISRVESEKEILAGLKASRIFLDERDMFQQKVLIDFWRWHCGKDYIPEVDNKEIEAYLVWKEGRL